ncbi:MAG: bifunctional (p)ppGpp synthetase/guanosine-3',5'-bis(diphosphate) 3'-pyrophosphohydrolase [Clostridia bacterium]|nr:bifunctional (p)ppGpp synthetase/guanosine-3',5'-bis(diphosphate) 3'-pyrophosphohydrolase [Clostridia bacterium]
MTNFITATSSDAYFTDKQEKLIERVTKYNPGVDADRIRRAFAYAKEMHGDQRRDSGEPYIAHPLEVAAILADLEVDEPTIIAALLHDCVEDTGSTLSDVTELFGADIAMLVDGVTKLDTIEFISKDEAKAESFRKMFVAMAKDMRVVIIKLADRLHNMRTLKYREEAKRRNTAKETIDIYAPLADRLGIYSIKWELEDLCLRTLDPQGFYDLVEKVNMKRAEREEMIEHICSKLNEKVEELGIKAQIDGRPKHFYSIYKKMKKHSFEQIYDLIAVRVIVPEVRDCYDVLGIVHQVWKPIAGRFKDYISVPKPNFYQSLHTTVLGDNGMPFEVQIRTFEMHRVAEYGVAAHWKYKEGAGYKATAFDEKLSWMRQMNDLQSEMRDPREFIDTLKNDVFTDEVFVFTPKGDVVDLPSGSTPIDFAYRIHSAVGHKCIGAKVNQRIVTLDTPLQTGDIVQVITSPTAKGPSMDWLKIVKTSQAKAKIRQWQKSQMKGENIERGKSALEAESQKQGYQLSKIMNAQVMEEIMRKYSFHEEDDLYASIGFGGVSAINVVTRLANEYKRAEKAATIDNISSIPTAAPSMSGKSIDGVFVKGESGMLVRFAKCCHPVRGDAIVGYITRGRGVSVHRKDCTNLMNAAMEGARLVEVSWDYGAAQTFNADIQIVAYDRPGMLANLTTMITTMEVPMLAISARTQKNRTAIILMTLEIKNTDQLERVIKQFQKSADVIEVFRTSA